MVQSWLTAHTPADTCKKRDVFLPRNAENPAVHSFDPKHTNPTPEPFKRFIKSLTNFASDSDLYSDAKMND